MMGELSLALRGRFPAWLPRQCNPFPSAACPLPSLELGGCLLALLQLTAPSPTAPGWAGHASLLHRIGAGRKRKWKRSMGQRGMKQSKPKDRIWLEKEQHKGGEPSFRGEPHTGQAETTSGRTRVQLPGPHQHCGSLLGLV